jgi:hypothetical protein
MSTKPARCLDDRGSAALFRHQYTHDDTVRTDHKQPRKAGEEKPRI